MTQAAALAAPLAPEILVIGSGPGGSTTATMLAEAGCDVLLIEEGPYLPLESAPHFSREEIVQKYRNAGINIAFGRAKIAFVEGNCVGGGSEINRGLYHRTPEGVLERWRREYRVDALEEDRLRSHFEACEAIARVQYLPGPAPAISSRLQQGATSLGWASMEVPRLFVYGRDWNAGSPGRKQSMTETFVPRFLAAGGRLLADARAMKLARHGGRWRASVEHRPSDGPRRVIEISAATVFVAAGATGTPALLRRSGIKRNVGDQLRFHPMVKAVARFPDEVNLPGELEPVHQVKQFDPRFSMGCSMSKRPALALAMAPHPDRLGEVDADWRRMAIYYAQNTGGIGTVRPIPGFRDPLVRVRQTPQDLAELAEGLRRLCECLLAAGAEAVYPSLPGFAPVRSMADVARMPDTLPPDRASTTALHLFSSCPMGEDTSRCAADSFGRVHGVDGLHIADCSLLPTPTVVNPQGSVMAIAHRNVMHFLERAARPGAARAIPEHAAAITA
ncbi:GMC family oxidoreductase N-terminal domain-containing protein [Falsiroseomonas sp.]|uniref:GMC family oxidoreductase N-terminal domain-containing protein n=1 Tax=Falsiroseomonas sp. TaxID=2870721 RepID=UPI0035650CEE